MEPEFFAGLSLAAAGVERQLVAADQMQAEAVALFDLAASLVEEQLVPLFHLGLELAEHVDRIVHVGTPVNNPSTGPRCSSAPVRSRGESRLGIVSLGSS